MANENLVGSLLPNVPMSRAERSASQATPAPRVAVASTEDLPKGSKISVVACNDLASLEKRVPEWEDLAKAAIEPNVFYESWALLPSLKAFGTSEQFVVALVFAAPDGDLQKPPLLCGLFPLVRERRYKGLPISVLRLWQHKYCPLCTPLIRRGYAAETLDAFFKWLADSQPQDAHGSPLLELRFVSGDGPFGQALADYLYNSTQLSLVEECFTRAVFRPAENADQYLSNALSGRRRKELRAQARHLSAVGEIKYAALDAGDDVDRWMTEFLRLEAGGWKGQEGTAIASKKEDQEFFRQMARSGFKRGQLRMLSLDLDGQPIAKKLDLIAVSPDGIKPIAYTLKIAYDEAYARFSPGVMLEIHNLRRMHDPVCFDWVDSCAVPNHFMINRLFTSRRILKTVLVATGRKPGGLILSLLPLLRWFNRALRGVKTQAAPSE